MTLEELVTPNWEILRMSRAEGLGYIPMIILPEQYDPRPVVDQVNDRYAHGGGWHKFEGFKFNRNARTLSYPGDPPYHAIAMLQASEKERVFVFDYAWVLIDRGLEDWEVSRMD